MKQLIEVIKQVALAAVREDKPTEIVFGTVVDRAPVAEAYLRAGLSGGACVL